LVAQTFSEIFFILTENVEKFKVVGENVNDPQRQDEETGYF